jgi:hypothetical protein
MRPNRIRSLIAVMVIAILAGGTLAPAIHAGTAASLSGKVYQPDGRTPRSGVVVSLVDDEGTRQLRSAPTTDEGSFVIDEATAGEYLVVVETPEGAFVTGASVELTPGANRPVALTLRTDEDFQQPQFAASSGGGLPTWAKWVIAGGIIVGALFVIDQINSDEDPASGF